MAAAASCAALAAYALFASAAALETSLLYEQMLRAPHAEGFFEANPLKHEFHSRPSAAERGVPPPPPPQAVFFSGVFSNYTVLQRAPAASVVFGVMEPNASARLPGSSVSVSVTDTSTGKTTRVAATLEPATGHWRAKLAPQPAGGNFTITASCTSCGGLNSSTIHSVTFGDVFVCSGQSNMQLAMIHTFDRNVTYERIASGKYMNIRTMQLQEQPLKDGINPWILPPRTSPQLSAECGGGSCASTWVLPDAMANMSTRDKENPWKMVPVLDSFSGACFYFATELTDIMWSNESVSGPPVPIGLIETAVGGTMIEAWLSNETLKKSCTNQTGGPPAVSWLAPGNGALYNGMILPLVNFTIKGALWYQGENNCAECQAGCNGTVCVGSDVCGNVLKNTGYPCMLKAMVEEWRAMWSVEPGTTDPSFPFGVYTLASTEGQCGDGSFRHSQTLNYGILPSPQLANTFVAQGYDAQDPVSIANWPTGARGCRAFGYNSPYSMGGGDNNQAVPFTPFFMGPIHPRPKHIIGRRMAQAAAAHVYNDTIAWTGPVIKTCNVSTDGRISVYFDENLLKDDAVHVFSPIDNTPWGPYDLHPSFAQKACAALPNGSANPMCTSFGGVTPMEVEYTIPVNSTTNVSLWLPVSIQPNNGPFINTNCPPKEKQKPGQNCVNGTRKAGWNYVTTHVSVPFSGRKPPVPTNRKLKLADLITGLRYAWSASPCCPALDRGGAPCPPNSCPIHGWNSTLPAAPFYAKIVSGRCECTPPQVCSK